MSDLRHAFPPLYATLYPRMVEIGRGLGYAVAIHGSLARDLDIVAVPWTDEAASAEDLVQAIATELGWIFEAGMDPRPGAGKPHGRRAWTLILSGGAFVDLSIMPRTTGVAQEAWK